MGSISSVGKMVTDGWKNLLTGLGSSADKKKSTRHRIDRLLPDDKLTSIFIEDGLGTRIVKEMPNDMFREGWDYSFPSLDDVRAKKALDVYKDIMESIGVVAKLRAGFYWARLYGGAVILIGALDGQELDQPLRPERIRSFDNLRIITRRGISFDKIQFQLDPTMPRYGLPEYYPISFEVPGGNVDYSKTQLVHYTRIIELHGEQVPPDANDLSKEQRYWGLSVIQNAYDNLRTMGASLGGVSSLLEEFSVGKFKLSNLADILSQPDGKELIQRRIEVNDLTRSMYRSMYFDKEDDFIRENVSFGGIPEVLYIFMMMVSSCSGYPITRLFGVSPAGLNSTGEGDMRNYYDRVHAEQVATLEPIILRLVKIISAWQKVEEPYIEWRPLQQLTDKEKSELEREDAQKEQIKAQTWKTYIDAGMLEPYQAAYLQFGDELDKIPVPEGYELPPVEPAPEPDDTEARIAELEAKEELSETEQKELDELRGKL